MLSILRARRRPLRRALAVLAAGALALGGASVAQADDLADGDALAALNGQTFALGQIACNTDATKQVVVAIQKTQGGNNGFKSGATISVNAETTSLGVSVSPSDNSIKLDSGWSKKKDGFSDTLGFTVQVHPVAPGEGRGNVTFTASGANDSNGTTLTRSATVNFTWTGGPCLTDTTVDLTCPASTPYTGGALTPCSATVTGDGLNNSLTVRYGGNTNAGTATATASYEGDGTHKPSSATTTFVIAKAPSVVSVSCMDGTYTGKPLDLCSAKVTGAGGLDQTLTPAYSDNVNAGQATASASYGGDANHDPSKGAAMTTIKKAASQVEVRCAVEKVTYDGSAHDVCSARVTGPALDAVLPVSYDDNKNVGTVTVSATFPGDDNHAESAASATFAISPAASVTTISCSNEPQTYDGSAHRPCTATVTGAGGLAKSVEVAYENNVDAGTARVTAQYAGDQNHDASSASTSFEIGKAAVQVRVSCPEATIVYDGMAHSPCSATVTGPAGLSEALAVSYGDNVNSGVVTASAHYAESDNYLAGDGNATFEITKATSTITLVCDEATYDATPLEPCTAAIEGAGVIDTSKNSLKVDYADNTNAGLAHVSASWEGDRNHLGTSEGRFFTIKKAESEIKAECHDMTYTGEGLKPCSATVDGIGGVDTSENALEFIYTNNINAGTGSVAVIWDGDSNHNGTTTAAHFAIAKADSVVSVSCVDGTFTGTPLDLCSAQVTGAGGLDVDLLVSYRDNVNAGTWTASASYAGDPNHEKSSGSAQFTIAKAASHVTVECDVEKVTYDGSAHDVCTARVTGPELDKPLTVSYGDNTNAGNVTASAKFTGDDNHNGSTGSATFAISPAASVTTISCSSEPQTFDGFAHTPCTAEVTGVGGLKQDVDVTYKNNVNAGTATVTAEYAGDRNHDGSQAESSFEIGKAPVEVIVTCSVTSVTYDGKAHAPCSATVTGPDGLSQGLEVSYTGNGNAGMVTASAHYAESDNYLAGDGAATFEITKAGSSITLTCPSEPQRYSGAELKPCTATVRGVGTIDDTVPVILTYSANVKAGPATVTATWAGDDNHTNSTASGSFTIAGWTLTGYDRPVDMSTSSTAVWNSIKGGSTVPLKFGASAFGRTITTTSELGATFTVTGVACPGSTAVTADVEMTTTGGTELRYAGGQFIQNWQTPKKAGACYRVATTTADGSSLSALFMLK